MVNKLCIIELCVPRLLSSVHEMDCLGEETVPVSGRSGGSELCSGRPDGSISKRECAGCEGPE